MGTIRLIASAILMLTTIQLISCSSIMKTVKREPKKMDVKETAVIDPYASIEIVAFGEPEQLTFSDAYNGNGYYHPDDDRIVFQSDRDGRWQIYELDLGTYEEQPLFINEFNNENPVWIPDGSILLFVFYEDIADEMNCDISFYSPEEDIVAPLVSSPGDDWYPVPVDSESFVFLSEREADLTNAVGERPNVLIKKSYFTGTQPITMINTDYDISAPAVYTNNQFIVRTDDARIAIFNPETNDLDILTLPGLRCGNPTYSASRNMIVFSGYRKGDYGLYMYDLDNRTLRRIGNIEGEIHYPHFSPDENWLLFSRDVADHHQLFRLSLSSE